jgi:hypothetical protein
MKQVYGELVLAVRPEGHVGMGTLTQAPPMYCEARGQELPARAPLPSIQSPSAMIKLPYFNQFNYSYS